MGRFRSLVTFQYFQSFFISQILAVANLLYFVKRESLTRELPDAHCAPPHPLSSSRDRGRRRAKARARGSCKGRLGAGLSRATEPADRSCRIRSLLGRDGFAKPARRSPNRGAARGSRREARSGDSRPGIVKRGQSQFPEGRARADDAHAADRRPIWRQGHLQSPSRMSAGRCCS